MVQPTTPVRSVTGDTVVVVDGDAHRVPPGLGADMGSGDDGAGALVDGDVTVQAHQALRNLTAVLEAAGKSLDDVVRIGVYLTDMGDFAAMNEVYREHLSAPYPARTAIAVAALPLRAVVEVDAIAS